MRVPEEVKKALKRRDESMLYHVMHELYAIINVEAYTVFDVWQLAVCEEEAAIIERVSQKIYDNVTVFLNE